jgi:hypothetical protein
MNLGKLHIITIAAVSFSLGVASARFGVGRTEVLVIIEKVPVIQTVYRDVFVEKWLEPEIKITAKNVKLIKTEAGFEVIEDSHFDSPVSETECTNSSEEINEPLIKEASPDNHQEVHESKTEVAKNEPVAVNNRDSGLTVPYSEKRKRFSVSILGGTGEIGYGAALNPGNSNYVLVYPQRGPIYEIGVSVRLFDDTALTYQRSSNGNETLGITQSFDLPFLGK